MNVYMTLVRESDLERLMDWRTRPYITEFMNTDPILTMQSQLEWYSSLKNNPSQVNWVINFEAVPVGLISLLNIDRVNHRCSWGYYIAERDYRSLRLATFLEWNLYDYVFDFLGLHKLCYETFTENAWVVKLHAMCGSKEEGIMRHHIFKNSRYHDVTIGSILAEEWLELRKSTRYEKFIFE